MNQSLSFAMQQSRDRNAATEVPSSARPAPGLVPAEDASSAELYGGGSLDCEDAAASSHVNKASGKPRRSERSQPASTSRLPFGRQEAHPVRQPGQPPLRLDRLSSDDPTWLRPRRPQVAPSLRLRASAANRSLLRWMRAAELAAWEDADEAALQALNHSQH